MLESEVKEINERHNNITHTEIDAYQEVVNNAEKMDHIKILSIPDEHTWKAVGARSLYDWCSILEKKHGYERHPLAGMIGNGTKVHRLHCTYKHAEDGIIVAHAQSHCGSQKWTLAAGHSTLRIITNGTEGLVDCQKCRRGRAKGYRI